MAAITPSTVANAAVKGEVAEAPNVSGDILGTPPLPKAEDQGGPSVSTFLKNTGGLKSMKATAKLYLVPLYSDGTDHPTAAQTNQLLTTAQQAATYWRLATNSKVNLTPVMSAEKQISGLRTTLSGKDSKGNTVGVDKWCDDVTIRSQMATTVATTGPDDFWVFFHPMAGNSCYPASWLPTLSAAAANGAANGNTIMDWASYDYSVQYSSYDIFGNRTDVDGSVADAQNLAHELGHNLGSYHSGVISAMNGKGVNKVLQTCPDGSWAPFAGMTAACLGLTQDGTSTLSNGRSVAPTMDDYGDPVSIMGVGPLGIAGLESAGQLYHMGKSDPTGPQVISDSMVTSIEGKTPPTTYTLNPLGPLSGNVGIRIPITSVNNGDTNMVGEYWIEYRQTAQEVGAGSTLSSDGIQVRFLGFHSANYPEAWLLPLKTGGDWGAYALGKDQTWSDPTGDLKVKTISTGGTTAQVQVETLNDSVNNKVVTQPQDATYYGGETVKLTAVGNSTNVAPTVKWEQSSNGTTWVDAAVTPTTTTANTRTTSQLNIPTYYNDGHRGMKYRATFSATGGASVQTNVATITQAPDVGPHYLASPATITAQEGARVTVKLPVIGDPTLAGTGNFNTEGMAIVQNAPITGNVQSFTFTATSGPQPVYVLAAQNSNRQTTVTGQVNVVSSAACTFTNDPGYGALAVGDTLNLSVGNKSAACAGYSTQWQKRLQGSTTWQPISGATTESYAYKVQAGDDLAQFQAILTSGSTKAQANPTVIRASGATSTCKITTQPSDQTVNVGQMATFTVGSQDCDGWSLQWVKNPPATWANVDNATGPTLSYTPTSTTETGTQFKAVFSNGTNKVESSFATMTVKADTTCVGTVTPTSITVAAGDVAKLTASPRSGADCTGASIQWKKKAIGSTTWTNVTNGTTATLNYNVTPADSPGIILAPFYRGSDGVTRDPETNTTLTVDQCTITTQPSDVTGSDGDVATFKIAKSSGCKNYTASWEYSLNLSTWKAISGQTGLSYNRTLSDLDDGIYIHAVLKYGGAYAVPSLPAQISITPPETCDFDSGPSSLFDATVGEPATFHAQTNGNCSGGEVQWKVRQAGGEWETQTYKANDTAYERIIQADDTGAQVQAVYVQDGAEVAWTSEAMITTRPNCIIQQSPADLIKAPGEHAVFTITRGSGCSSEPLQWEVTKGSAGTVTMNPTSADTLDLGAVTPEMAGWSVKAILGSGDSQIESVSGALSIAKCAFAFNPAGDQVTSGQSAYFSATPAYGCNGYNQTWQTSRDGTTWTDVPSASGQNTYQFKTALTDDGLKVRSQLKYGTLTPITSTVASLKVTSTATCTAGGLQSQIAQVGRFAIFNLSMSDCGDGVITWQKSTDRGQTWNTVPGETTSHLSWTPTASDNGVMVRASVTTDSGTVWANPATVTIQQCTFSKSPASINTWAGEVAYFSATPTSGNCTGYSVSWQRQAASSQQWVDIPNSTSYSYGTVLQAAESGTKFRAILTPAGGGTPIPSSPATATVSYWQVTSCQIAQNPASIISEPGKQTSFNVAPGAYCDGYSLNWQKKAPGAATFTDIPSAASETLWVTPTGDDGGSVYRAVYTKGTDKVYSDEATMAFTPCVFEVQPYDKALYEGTNFSSWIAGSASCDAYTLKWQSQSKTGNTWTDIPGSTGSNAIPLTPATLDMNGSKYRAVFTSGSADPVISEVMTLTVKSGNECMILSQPGSVLLNPGDSTRLQLKTSVTCNSSSWATYQWQKKMPTDPTWSDIPGGDAYSIDVKARSDEAGMQYRVIMNAVGKTFTSEAATVDVRACEITRGITNRTTAKVGEKVTYSIEVGPGCAGYRLMWGWTGANSPVETTNQPWVTPATPFTYTVQDEDWPFAQVTAYLEDPLTGRQVASYRPVFIYQRSSE